MHTLNPAQREAVVYLDGPLLVLAGAGSGKTRVITRKIAHLIGQVGLSARNIFALTFTNKAAREMKERVGQLVRGRDASGLHISTFHTLGINILKREHARLGLRPGFSLFDQEDAQTLLKELLRHQQMDAIPAERVQWRISHWKNNLVLPGHALSQAKDEVDARDAQLYIEYQRALRSYNAVDFDDLILLPVELFRDEPEVLGDWQNRVRYLLVDEYQDTNTAQYELVRMLTGVRQALTVVGDDDQSIYAWRGARPENLAQLQLDMPRLRVIKLEQNYRSTGRILKAANRLIANNPHVFEKALWSGLGPGDPIRILTCRDEAHEAERVVSEIIHRHFQQEGPRPTQYGDFAILYRGNHQARAFETQLRQNRVPYFLSGGTSFFSRAEVKDVMAYLRLLANPTDDAAFLRIINTPRREVGPTTLERLAAFAGEKQCSLLVACGELGLGQALGGRALERLDGFARWMAGLARRSGSEHPVRLVEAMLDELDYRGWLRQQARDETQANRRWENVSELLTWMGRLYEGKFTDRSLAGLVNHLTLQDALEQKEEGEEDQVHLMTLHSAKGLEFPHVFLVGVEEERLPHRASIEEDTIEEERRLAYVGITRAQRTLTITLAERRRGFGEFVVCKPSRFLAELPEEDLEWEGPREKVTPEKAKARAVSHLANMKSILGK